MFVFAHLSDVHLDLGPRALGRTRRVMDYLRGLPIDAILVTGDIADHGDAAEYEQARDELSIPAVPVLILPGNHDDRSAFTKVLRDQEATGPVNLARRIDEVLFLLCDSSIPRHNEGLLEPETLAWIQARWTRPKARHSSACTTCRSHWPSHWSMASGSSRPVAWPRSWPSIHGWWPSYADTRTPPPQPLSPAGLCW
jgi:3',5'-cyclic AMP phosphodiesterase CpdA